MNYHVSKQGHDHASGTEEQPFLTISRAAEVAMPGDTVIVHSGIYREWVNPANGGTIDQPITYKVAGDGEVVITGADRITDWTHEGDNVWRTEVPNTHFKFRNPYDVLLSGDWLFDGALNAHLGEVYLDHQSLYECGSLAEVQHPKVWSDAKHPKDSLLKWYCEVGSTTTSIWANFGDKDPRTETVEINVRKQKIKRIHC